MDDELNPNAENSRRETTPSGLTAGVVVMGFLALAGTRLASGVGLLAGTTLIVLAGLMVYRGARGAPPRRFPMLVGVAGLLCGLGCGAASLWSLLCSASVTI
jgi:hypothetical protein